MSTSSKRTTYIDNDGLPTELDVDGDLWGSGTAAERPASGTVDKDIYLVFDNATGEYRFEIWDATAASWVPFQGDPVGAASDGTHGDVLYHDGTKWAVLSPGTAGEFLKTQGSGSAPVWDTPAGGGGGITESQHNALRQLIHFISDGPGTGETSGAYRESLPAADPFPTSVIWYTDSGKTAKIVELTITRNANQTPSTEVWEMYDTDGSTVLVTLTDTISYSGIFETSRTRTWV